MTTVKLRSLTLEDFKGIKSLTIDPQGESLSISAANKVGKTTLFDSWLWLLFGKDSNGNADGNYIPIKDGEPNRNVTPSVEATITINGNMMTLKRSIKQKFKRARGEEESKYNGTETLYEIDGVAVRQADYNAAIKNISSEEIFKLSSDPAAFLAQHWTKQREILYKLTDGLQSIEDVATKKPEWQAIIDQLNGKTLAEWKKAIAASTKKMKAELAELPIKIEQTEAMKPVIEAVEVAETKEELEQLLQDLNAQLYSKTDAQLEQEQQVAKLLEEVNAENAELVKLKSKQSIDKMNHDRAESQRKVEALKLADQAEAEQKRHEGKMDDLADSIAINGNKKGNIQAAIEDLRNSFNAVRDETFDEHKLICPTCKQALTIEEQERLKAEYTDTKRKRLQEINEHGQKLKASIEHLDNKLVAETQELEARRSEIAALEEAAEKAADEFKQIKNSITEYRDDQLSLAINVKQQLIDDLQRRIEDAKKPRQDEAEEARKAEITAEIQQAQNKLKALQDREASEAQLQKSNAEIARLENEMKRIGSELATLEASVYAADELTGEHNRQAETAINKLFKRTRFSLFSYNVDGTENEACIATDLAGVPYATTNRAEQINIGIDIINTLSQQFGISAPIWIDNAEAVNTLEEADTQVISLHVSRDKEFVIEKI